MKKYIYLLNNGSLITCSTKPTFNEFGFAKVDSATVKVGNKTHTATNLMMSSSPSVVSCAWIEEA